MNKPFSPPPWDVTITVKDNDIMLGYDGPDYLDIPEDDVEALAACWRITGVLARLAVTCTDSNIDDEIFKQHPAGEGFCPAMVCFQVPTGRVPDALRYIDEVLTNIKAEEARIREGLAHRQAPPAQPALIDTLDDTTVTSQQHQQKATRK